MLNPSVANCLNAVIRVWDFYWSPQCNSLFTWLPEGRSECGVIFTQSAPRAGSESVGNHWHAQGQDENGMYITSSLLCGYMGGSLIPPTLICSKESPNIRLKASRSRFAFEDNIKRASLDYPTSNAIYSPNPLLRTTRENGYLSTVLHKVHHCHGIISGTIYANKYLKVDPKECPLLHAGWNLTVKIVGQDTINPFIKQLAHTTARIHSFEMKFPSTRLL